MKFGSIPKLNTKARFFWFISASAIFLVFIYAFTAWSLFSYGKINIDPGYELQNHGSGWRVDYVFAEGPAFGKLQAGDVILAMNGDESARKFAPVTLGSIPLEQESYTMRVERDGKEFEFALVMQLTDSYINLLHLLPPLPSSIAFVVVGLLIGALRTEDSPHRINSKVFRELQPASYKLLRPLPQSFRPGA